MPEGVHWFIWRPIIAEKTTLTELETHYSLNDLFQLHCVMDAIDEAEAKIAAKNRPKGT